MTAQEFMSELQVKSPLVCEIRIVDASGDTTGYVPAGVTYHPPEGNNPHWVSIDFDSSQS